MSFRVAAEAYDRFMGRFSEPLADRFVELLEPARGQRALDVGCGPGALTSRLVERLGAGSVTAVDPSEPFTAAVAARLPGVDVHQGTAEALPLADGTYDVAAAQLVVHFMADPVSGLAEMRRVTRPGGTVAACVWDHAGGSGPLTAFWAAAHRVDPAAPGESDLPGTREGHLEQLARAAGLRDVVPGRLTVVVAFSSFDDWWAPFTLGVGPAGDYLAALDEDGRARLERACREALPEPPFSVAATAWTVRGRA